MKLFKYVSAEILRKIIENKQIRFTQFSELNDPYECEVFSDNVKINLEELNKDKRLTETDKFLVLKGSSDNINKKQKEIKNEINNRFLVLSLSKNEKNLLMWSHYAENHKGAVIELNMNHEIFFEDDIIINHTSGDVNYNKLKPNLGNPFGELMFHKTAGGYSLKSTGFNGNVDVFLNKSIDWYYEEEVRVIKDKFKSNNITSFQNIHLYPLPFSAINCIILGARFNDENLKTEIKNMSHDFDLKKSIISNENYQIKIESV
ncbi:DUF2971 domain-containing protein [Ancylomarina sp. YFZ004]